MPRDTLIDYFNDFANAKGQFLVHDDGFRARSHSYVEVGRAARGFASRLADNGIRKGDKVVFWSENRPEWIVAFWGCLLGGVIVVPIDYRASPEFMVRIARRVDARLILLGEDVPAAPEALNVPVWRLHELEWRDGSPPAVTVDRDDVAEIIFTSGATGEPKGVVITHRNVLANIEPVEREVRKYRSWARPVFPLRFLNLLPLSHMFGQAMATFIPPMLPGAVVFMRGYNPADIVALIRRRRVSVLVSVPKILDVLRTHVLRASADAAQVPAKQSWVRRWWRYRQLHRLFGPKFWAFVVGAAPLDSELEAFWSSRGFAVVQGYGLTETAPIVSVTHPFHIQAGSVGKAIAGVDVKIAPDGEILVRGENVTSGYFEAEAETAAAFEGGWFHTGDIGEIGPDGRLFIRGRKKEVIVTPEGLKVFPDDVERVVNEIPGVRDSAAVGVATTPETAGERVHIVLVVDRGVDPAAVVRDANARLESHQKIRRALVWPQAELPRTEGTGKLKRAAIRDWVRTGAVAVAAAPARDTLSALVAKYAGRGDLSATTTIDELGLSSLERVELMVALEDAFQTRLDEKAFSGVHDVGQLRALVQDASKGEVEPPEALEFPAWNRSLPARMVRRVALPGVILPLARIFAWVHVDGRQHLSALEGPVIFASNHQSYMDTPVIMAALPRRWRYRVAPAMSKEFFTAHFFPEGHGLLLRLATSAAYYLAALLFDAFPLPQREAGARQTLRYMGEVVEDGFSVLIFPEGHHTDTGEIDRFRPGIGMVASRLEVPVVPVRLEGVDRVLHRTWHMARPGHVRVTFGPPMRLTGTDYEALARQVEDAVRSLSFTGSSQTKPGVDAMRFKNREDAASQLAERLIAYKGQKPLILGVPRGAVPMARTIAEALGGELDVVLVRKLRAPAQPELAIGAVDEAGAVLKGRYFDVADAEYLRKEIRAQQDVIRARREMYTRAQRAIDPAGRIVVIVDDGIATGSSMLAAIRSVRAQKPRKLIVAIGVAPRQSLAQIQDEADEVVCLHAPADFYAVGQFFEDFSEVTDDMVVSALSRSARAA